ncbi:MAG TPA: DUF1697 domain-containing protein [Candidatus Saccharimonadales bacterium]|nr:DUF1697 domain-containing protein [Candidatus Saccharimonadales bacterium]
MSRYVALLRAINVGGHSIKMEQLRNLFTELGFSNVKSYINSGNIFFDADNIDREKLTTLIEQHLYEALGYKVPTFLRTVSELQSIVSQDPFHSIKLTDQTRFCVIFTNKPIDNTVALPQHSSKNDMDLVAVNEREAFVVWHIVNGRPPSGKFPEGVIPPENTSRFYHTLAKILQAAKV